MVATARATRPPGAPPAPPAPAGPHRLPWSGDPAADRLLARDPLALLIGFVLDQQVPAQTAFRGPLRLRQRAGTLDPGRLARLDPAELGALFAAPPAIHRFPQMMAERVRALCQVVVERHQGDAARIWREVPTARELRARLAALPGLGPMKVATILALLAKQYGVRPDGWEQALPAHPTLADVTSEEELAVYQAEKRAHKAALRTAGARP